MKLPFLLAILQASTILAIPQDRDREEERIALSRRRSVYHDDARKAPGERYQDNYYNGVQKQRGPSWWGDHNGEGERERRSPRRRRRSLYQDYDDDRDREEERIAPRRRRRSFDRDREEERIAPRRRRGFFFPDDDDDEDDLDLDEEEEL